MSERAVPFHCPYCGDENLRPHEQGHGTWECHACLRAFSLKMLGLLSRGGEAAADPAPSGPTPVDQRTQEARR